MLSSSSCSYGHRPRSLTFASVYALIISSVFVLNLYLLVPKSIQKLPRNDPRQIKWRIFSVLATVILCIATYPLTFCHINDHNEDFSMVATGWKRQHLLPLFHYPCFWCRNTCEYEFSVQSKSLSAMLGLSGWNWSQTLLPLFHAIILYFGSICAGISQHRILYLYQNRGSRSGGLSYIKTFFSDTFLKKVHILSEENKWTMIRDCMIAPIAEELIFRSCIITPFLYSEAFLEGRLSVVTISWCTPLFFGVAHFHHVFKKIKQGDCSIKAALLSTAFQFLYTTIFGAYASFCFIKTGSVFGVILLHSFCNFMGLPSIQLFFLKSKMSSDLQTFKFACILAYAFGIISFWIGFYSPRWHV